METEPLIHGATYEQFRDDVEDALNQMRMIDGALVATIDNASLHHHLRGMAGLAYSKSGKCYKGINCEIVKDLCIMAGFGVHVGHDPHHTYIFTKPMPDGQ